MSPLRIASLRLPLRRRGSRTCIPTLRLLLPEETNQKRYKVKALEPCRRDHFSTALSHFPRSGRTFCRHLCRRERLLGPGAVRRRTHLRARFQSSLLRRRKCLLLGFSPGVFLPRTYGKKKGKQELKKSVVRGKKAKDEAALLCAFLSRLAVPATKLFHVPFSVPKLDVPISHKKWRSQWSVVPSLRTLFRY